MSDNSDRVGVYLLVGMFLGSAIIAISIGLPKWDLSIRLWLGEKGILENVAAMMTPIAATVAAVVAIRTYGMNVDAGIAARFQKGLELLTSNSVAARTGGVTILEDLARLKPEDYLGPSCQAIAARITDLSTTAWGRYFQSDEDINDLALIAAADQFTGINAIARTDVRLRWKSAALHGVADRLTIFRPHLNMVTFRNLDFTRIEIRAAAFGVVAFEDCTFENFEMKAALRSDCVFRRCKFKGTVSLDTSPGDLTRGDRMHGRILLRDTREFGLTINGVEIGSDGEYGGKSSELAVG